MQSNTHVIMTIAGARPNFMKIAPIARELAKYPTVFRHVLVHTGQHYDDAMSTVFFRDLGIPKPDVNLNVGSGSQAVQTAEIMKLFEPVLLQYRPELLIVVGDVNSTMACTLVAAKLGIPVAHVEAGLRSFDRTMPEEINRVVTDHLSDLLFVSEQSGVDNLINEGIAGERIHFAGNVMIDTLLSQRERARELAAWRRFGLEPKAYAVLTLHRPANVDNPRNLGRIMEAVLEIARDMPVLFPVHPRTRQGLVALGLASGETGNQGLIVAEPLGYLDFMSVVEASSLVLTDSGGIQEETTILEIPCLTLRPNTERPATVLSGWNRIVGIDPRRIIEAYRSLGETLSTAAPPKYWDGHAAERIVGVLKSVVTREPEQAVSGHFHLS
jgi:UDP-N-acetylglucosamine 2-epimerase (non-hydrolysing)